MQRTFKCIFFSPLNDGPLEGGGEGMYIYSDKSQKTYIFRWHNFFELIQSEFFFSFTNILSENLFQPLYILFVKNSTHPT